MHSVFDGESWAEQGSSSWVTVVEIEFQHLMCDPATPHQVGLRPDRLHPGLNVAVNAVTNNGLLAWLHDGTVVHSDWSSERQCFLRRDKQSDLPLALVRAWAALPEPIAKA
jgi:hypothetical protein